MEPLAGTSRALIGECVPIVIEVIDGTEIPIDELAEFVDANPIAVDTQSLTTEDVSEHLTDDKECVLITKLIDGQLTFSEYNEQLGNTDDVLEIEEDTEVESSGDVFNRELMEAQRESLRGNFNGMKRLKRRRCLLPAALQGLMGEANLCYARGQNDLAEKVCLEIIRQMPLASEPFLTLAQLYENSDREKCLQFSMIAAHLNPGDSDQWLRIADMYVEQKSTRQAIMALTRAIKAEPFEINLRMRRIELLDSIGEDKLAFRCYTSMLPFISPKDPDFLLEVAKTSAKRLHGEQQYAKALEGMQTAYLKIPDHFQSEDINLLLDLLIQNKNYRTVVEILMTHTELTTEFGVEDDLVSINMPDDLLLDFCTKLAVSIVHLRAFHLVDYVLEKMFLHMNTETDGDCFLDVAEALMAEEQWQSALRLLVPLVESENFSLAAVWLRHADCHRALNEFEKAIESYRRVVGLAPQHYEARLTLATLLKQTGQSAAALQAFEQDASVDMIEPGILYERCMILRELGATDELIDAGYLLISRHCLRLRSNDELAIAASVHKMGNKLSIIREMRETKNESAVDPEAPVFAKNSPNEPSLEQEWELFQHVLLVAFERQSFVKLQRMTFEALCSKRFLPYTRDIEFAALLACIFKREAIYGYNIVKEMVTKEMKSARLWNLFNIVILYVDDTRYRRFLLRLIRRREIHPIIQMIVINYCLLSGSYVYALNDYLSLFKKTRAPMLPLLIAVTLCQMACQKFSAKRFSLVTQAIAFIGEYRRLREADVQHEIDYNYGRLYHQMGLVSIAVQYYQRVLAYNHPLIDANEPLLSLRRMAAFNLHLIYRDSGNIELARKYLYDNIII